MKRTISKFLVLSILIFSITVIVTLSASASASLMNSTDIKHYGKTFLTDNQKILYELIDEGFKTYGDTVNIPYELEITGTDLQTVIEMALADHPEYFWVSGAYSYGIYGGTEIVGALYPEYAINEQEATSDIIEAAKTEFSAALSSIIFEMESSLTDPTDYEKALWLHDKVCDIVEYDYGPNNQNAYGALIDQKAVCAGYAELYHCLLLEAGIPGWSVKGWSLNPKTQTMENHEWNLLWIDGNCVYTDVTWDDQMDEIFHIYFARDIVGISPEHILNEDYETKIPECTPGNCDSYTYFDKVEHKHIITEEITTDMLAELIIPQIENKSFVAMLYAPNDTMLNSFNTWLSDKNNTRALMKKLTTSTSYSYTYWENIMGNDVLGEEIHLHIEKIELNSEAVVKVNDDGESCNAIISLGLDDYKADQESNNYKALLAFYDEEGTMIEMTVEEIFINESLDMTIPQDAATFKATIIDTLALIPLCSAGVTEVN